MVSYQNLSLCVPKPSSGLDPNAAVVAKSEITSVPADHILIRVDRFGFSANNYTYQALGEAPHFRYFEFHSAPEDSNQKISPKTHGLVPVWGFATIVESAHPKLRAGERIYGYLAPARYLLVPITSVNKYTMLVPRPHLPPDRKPYNQITRCDADAQYNPDPVVEDLTMLYRPLFWTAFWCEDWLNSGSYRGAKQVLISSASSKTAFCLAYCIRKRGIPDLKVIGLTSKGNVDFTKGLGLYDEVVEYNTFTETSTFKHTTEKFVYVDLTGNEKLNERIFAHFGPKQNLVCAVALGVTNMTPKSSGASSTDWSTNKFTDSRPAVATSLEQFFMPEWLTLRVKELSIPQITKLQTQAWTDLMKDCPPWVQLTRVSGPTDIVSAYMKVATGQLRPNEGYIWSLWDGAPAAKL